MRPRSSSSAAAAAAAADDDGKDALDDSQPEADDDLDMSDSDGGADLIVAEHDYSTPVADLRVFVPDAAAAAAVADDVDDLAVPLNSFFSPSLIMNEFVIDQEAIQPDNFLPVQLSNPNPTILGSSNLGLVDFLRVWALNGCFPSASRSRPPHLLEVYAQARAQVEDVTYADLAADECDLQGLDWTTMETTREDARARRQLTYNNYVNRSGSDLSRGEHDPIPSSDSFFRFKRINFRSDMSLAHFQLRSVLACPTRKQAYYTSPSGISRLDLSSRRADLAMNLHDYFPTMGAVVSTLDAAHGVLMGGTFNGDYYIQPLDHDGLIEGQISPDAITNHLRIHTPRRSSRPVASIASNDCGFRVLDIETDTFVSHASYDFALNCSALSPDRRLRVLVGDNPSVLIVNADTGETLQELAGHRDYGFSCDWSDDGWTVATGFQDKAVKIWDARRWCDSSGNSLPVCTLRSEMAGVRGLRFSPLGGGRPVLVAAEEADFVNLVDAKTFATKQTVDVFSEIGGIAFANDGQDLNVLCCDTHRGGLLQLERCGDGTAGHRRPTLLAGPDPF
ncbi:hypothetical protein L249_7284 [Ophiocordyceps polyrhachis-furcata BCC 54312]|uniref:Uncharacterized protein n=1 Tax=Ophiocordyceps polyrhachis-furcata BCC 54312 TaxID=1330021 RepID=A0A367L9M0_9HYPO|nr:hypothetical protein L249_7284 [Ophiocordyceps polyrhachis-furcata BCC 54312]